MNIGISLDDLKGEQRELAAVIGIAAYLKLVEIYGGTSIYIAKSDKIKNLRRDAAIAKEFTGYNYTAIARKYGLSERSVRDIITDQLNNNGQVTFDD